MRTPNSIDARLASLDIRLPEAPSAGGNYVAAKLVGGLCFLAGVVSAEHGAVITGVAGADRTVEEGYRAARACGLTQLAVLRRTLGTLDNVEQIVSVNGYVCATPGFAQIPAVLNGFSDLMVEVFGEAGRHARAAIGVASLPRNALVEVQMIVAVKSNPKS